MAASAQIELSELWQQVLSAPASQERKQQFIELLEKTTDPRAEIFRLVVELEKYPSYYVQHAGLKQQYEDSLGDWRRHFDDALSKWHGHAVFVKGWPFELTISAREFAAHAVEIVSVMPLRHLNLQAINQGLKVFNTLQLQQVSSIDGSNQPWSNEALRALIDSEYIGGLRWLDLSRCGLSEEQVELLAAAASLRCLEHLDLSNNPSRNPVDASAGYGIDGISGYIVAESIYLPDFGRELEERYGQIPWLHALDHYMEKHPPSRYLF